MLTTTLGGSREWTPRRFRSQPAGAVAGSSYAGDDLAARLSSEWLRDHERTTDYSNDGPFHQHLGC